MYVSEKDGYKLEIGIDDFPVSYGIENNLSTMISWHRRYNIGNEHNFVTPNDFFMDLVMYNVPKENVIDYVKSGKADLLDLKQEDDSYILTYYDKEKTESNIYRKEEFLPHEAIIDSIVQELKDYELFELVKQNNIIKPLYMFEHSDISISTVDYNDRWDSGQIGWIYISYDDIKKEYGAINEDTLKLAEDIINSEVENYDYYLRGELYYYELSHNGKILENCCGFIGDFEDVKNHIKDVLPDECKSMTENLQEIQPSNTTGTSYMNDYNEEWEEQEL